MLIAKTLSAGNLLTCSFLYFSKSIAAASTSKLSLRTMSSTLKESKCEPCSSNSATRLDSSAIQQLLSSLEPGWSLSPQPQTLQSQTTANPDGLKRSFRFKDFITAQGFANQISTIAEEQGHHPAILTEWGRVTVWWWSHSIKGLHKNDFVMAAKTDGLVQKAEGYRPPKPKAV